MLALILYLSLALCLNIPSQGAQDKRQNQVANPGDTATGEVLKEEGGQLQLNTKPCDREKAVITFRKPYVKESAGTIKCEGVERKLIQVIQK
jgi:hypothetical protein